VELGRSSYPDSSGEDHGGDHRRLGHLLRDGQRVQRPDRNPLDDGGSNGGAHQVDFSMIGSVCLPVCVCVCSLNLLRIIILYLFHI